MSLINMGTKCIGTKKMGTKKKFKMARGGLLVVTALLMHFGAGAIPALAQTNSQTNAQSNGRVSTHGQKSVRAAKAAGAFVLDGVFDEAAWKDAPVTSSFVQKDPNEGAAASEKTEFRVVYTTSTLYVGVTAYDSDPQAIVASERRRDGNLDNDDNLTLVMDTFHDHRNSYRFKTNALGTQADALITDEGNNTNEDWDENWQVASRITETGWTAEFAFPFKSLRLPMEDGAPAWGLDVERLIRRKNEDTFWANYHRGFEVESVSQAGHLNGISEIETGLKLRIKPYVLGGFSHTAEQRASHECRPSDTPFQNGLTGETCSNSNAGIEVIKYRITQSLTADLTFRTDFAQTEVDDQEVNLDRFPLFYPEKREFFQEGAGVFEFGIAQNENGQAVSKLFHSRQIGLSPRRLPIPIVGGGRITGRIGGLIVGMMNVQTERFQVRTETNTPTGVARFEENIAASNYSIFRVKRDVLNRSNIGGFFLNREVGGFNVRNPDGQIVNDRNKIYGADATFVFYRYLSMSGVVANSDDPRTTGRDWFTSADVKWDSDEFNLQASWHTVEANFRDDLGFIPRKDRKDVSPQIAWRPRPDGNKLIRQLIFRLRTDYTMNSKNVLQTRVSHSAFEMRLQNGDLFGWVPHVRFDTFAAPFSNRAGVWIIPPGSYSWWNNALRYGLNPGRRISGQIINWAWHVGYYGGGTLHDINFNPRIRITNQLSGQVGYGISKATFPTRMCVDKTVQECGFTDHVVNARLNYNFNNQWLTSSIIQYNNVDHIWGMNFRLNYIFRPGDDFFLIYNEGRRFRDENSGLAYGPNERTLQAKLTYSFDF
ncbi:MAG: hypothetical protein EXQ56_00905 [Acidobacteria bacterium]|nr:hypothetical protein [Acidobacteriota bacterium]